MDRAFVLASTTMDRHLTYVAMTRHREAVRLYVDGTEFCPQWSPRGVRDETVYGALEARLSRSGAKETVLDYAPAFAARRGLAERLGIRSGIVIGAGAVPKPPVAIEPVHQDLIAELRGEPALPPAKLPPSVASAARARTSQVESPRSSRFAGLRLRAGPSVPRPPEPERQEPAQDPVVDPLADRLRSRSDLERALERYLQAHDARERQAREGLPRLMSQREALEAAGLGLDAAQAGTQAALKEALQRDPQVRQALEEPPGPGQVVELMAGLDRERERQAQVELTAEIARQEQLRREQVRQLELRRVRELGLDLGR